MAVYSIDINKSSAKRSNGVCFDVLTFDFSKWPHPNLIWFSPPCTPWSNATPLTKRCSAAYIKMSKLCNWSIELASKFAPNGFILENPRHTKLIEQRFLTNVAYDHCSYCQYGFPYQKDTTLWHSDSIKLSLHCCNCKGPHEVKMGGAYGAMDALQAVNLFQRNQPKACSLLT